MPLNSQLLTVNCELPMTSNERKAALEAIIYAADEPATIDQLATALGEDKIAVQNSLDELVASYASDERGIEIRAVAGGYKMYTKPQHHDVVRRFIKSLRPPLRLSMPALETLAVIAYKQPVTAPEISEIRGVNTSGVISTLLDKKLITTAGRKEVMGRPILYKSSKEFLMRFGLSDLDELPEPQGVRSPRSRSTGHRRRHLLQRVNRRGASQFSQRRHARKPSRPRKLRQRLRRHASRRRIFRGRKSCHFIFGGAGNCEFHVRFRRKHEFRGRRIPSRRRSHRHKRGHALRYPR